MKKIHMIIILLLSSILFNKTEAQEVLSLSDAINIALKNNYDLRIIRMNEEISSINNTWGNTGAMPSINLNVNARENYNMNEYEDYRTQSLTPDVNLNWIIFNGFSARITKRQLEELELQSQGNTAVLVETTIQEIILAYNSCVLQKEMMDVYRELADLSKDRYDRQQHSESIGASSTYENLLAKTSWLEDQSNYLQQKVSYENALRTLNYIMAVDEDMMWELNTPLETDLPVYEIEDLQAKMLSGNQNLKNQYLYQSLLEKETSQARSNFYPSLSLNAGISHTNYENYYSGQSSNMIQRSYDGYAGLTLSFNIFNGGITRRSVQIAKINEEMSGVQTDQMVHSLKNQMAQVYSDFLVQKEVLDLAGEQLAAAKLNLDLSAEKLQNGSINSFNYRDVQTVYMNAALARFRAIYDLVQSNTNLLRITGGIINEYDAESLD